MNLRKSALLLIIAALSAVASPVAMAQDTVCYGISCGIDDGSYNIDEDSRQFAEELYDASIDLLDSLGMDEEEQEDRLACFIGCKDNYYASLDACNGSVGVKGIVNQSETGEGYGTYDPTLEMLCKAHARDRYMQCLNPFMELTNCDETQ